MSEEKNIQYCSECGGFIEWDTVTVLLSSPPKYKGRCQDCDSFYFAICSDVDNALNQPTPEVKHES